MPDPITRERIEALIAEHQKCSGEGCAEGDHCIGCLEFEVWPCDTYRALTMALAADGYREALEKIARYTLNKQRDHVAAVVYELAAQAFATHIRPGVTGHREGVLR